VDVILYSDIMVSLFLFCIKRVCLKMEIYPNPICDNLTPQFPIQLLNQDINNKSVGIIVK